MIDTGTASHSTTNNSTIPIINDNVPSCSTSYQIHELQSLVTDLLDKQEKLKFSSLHEILTHLRAQLLNKSDRIRVEQEFILEEGVSYFVSLEFNAKLKLKV